MAGGREEGGGEEGNGRGRRGAVQGCMQKMWLGGANLVSKTKGAKVHVNITKVKGSKSSSMLGEALFLAPSPTKYSPENIYI